MSDKVFWDRAAFTVSEMPSLRDLLLVCDSRLFARVVIEEFACRSARPSRQAYQSMEKRLQATRRTMLSLPVLPKQDKWVLFPRETFTFDREARAIVSRLHLDLVPMYSRTFLKELRHVFGEKTGSYKHVKKADLRVAALQHEQSSETKNPQQAHSRSYSVDLWEDVLACCIWLGGSWSVQERYIMLASAFWEMTFYGFEYDVVQARLLRKEKQGNLGSGDFRDLPSTVEQSQEKKKAKRACLWGLLESGSLEGSYEKSIHKTVSILNHNARCDQLDARLDLACRLKEG